jgi:hypothetical protein
VIQALETRISQPTLQKEVLDRRFAGTNLPCTLTEEETVSSMQNMIFLNRDATSSQSPPSFVPRQGEQG